MKMLLKNVVFLLILTVVMMTGINAKKLVRASSQTESDPVLELENWMVQDDYWTSKQIDVAPVEGDRELNFEQWMIDDCYWR